MQDKFMKQCYDTGYRDKIIPNYAIFKRSLAYNGPTIWNALPITIKTSSTIMQFKREYKNVFFNGLAVWQCDLYVCIYVLILNYV